MVYAKKVLNYWQQSVEDGDRLDFKEEDIKPNQCAELPLEEIKAGELSLSSFEKVEKKADWSKKGALDLLICPFPLFQKKKGRKASSSVSLGDSRIFGSRRFPVPTKGSPPFYPAKVPGTQRTLL